MITFFVLKIKNKVFFVCEAGFCKRLDFFKKNAIISCVMKPQTQLAKRVEARSAKLERELKMSERVATAKVARGNVYLLMGKYATEEDLQQRLTRLSKALKAFA